MGNEIDIEEYYRRYGPMVLRRCRRLLKDEELAVDAMQDVFVKLLRYEGRLDDSAPSSLLYRIATNICLNRIRSHKRKPETRDDELIARLADLSEAEERLSARSSLARLFGAQQESTATIAALHLLDGLTLEEVAREVGMSVSGVRKRLRPLKETLEDMEGVAT